MRLLLSKVDSQTQQKWLSLQEEGKFSLRAAEAVVMPISEQIEKGKNLDMIWDNRKQLPSLNDELKYMNEETAIIKLMHAFAPMLTLATGKNALSDKAAMTDFIKTMILDDEDLKRWRFADFRLMVIKAIKGEFGPIYDRIDANVVFGWINEYWGQRNQKIAFENDKERSQHNGPIHPEVAGKLSEMLKKVIPPERTHKRYDSPQALLESNPLMVDQWKSDYKSLDDPKMTETDFLILKATKANQL